MTCGHVVAVARQHHARPSLLVRCIRFGAVLTVSMALLPAGSIDAGSEPPCAVPDTVRAAGELASALPRYQQLLADDPELECATRGVEAIGSLRSEAAQLVESARTWIVFGRRDK